MFLSSFTLPLPWGGCNHDDTVIGLYPFSFTQAKLLFMAIRRLQFPEATVSQAASYCTTPGLWCRAQTLSPTPPPPLLFLVFPLLHFASLLCWFSELLFLSEKLYEATARKETRERDREGERGKQRASEENCDSSEAVIDATCVRLPCTLQTNRKTLLICSHISIIKAGSQPQIFLCTSMNDLNS